MGCSSSKKARKDEFSTLIKQQTMQIETLQHTNHELRIILENIIADSQRAKSNDTTDAVKRKITELELKIVELETKLASQSQESDDTFNRDSSDEEPPAILLESKGLEVSRSDGRVSQSIMDDPLIKERFERKRQMFLLKKNQQLQPEQDLQGATPTMMSSHVSNKPA